MCGRFTQSFAWDRADLLFDLSGLPLNLQPRYNVAPDDWAGEREGDGRDARSPTVWHGPEGHVVDPS